MSRHFANSYKGFERNVTIDGENCSISRSLDDLYEKILIKDLNKDYENKECEDSGLVLKKSPNATGLTYRYHLDSTFPFCFSRVTFYPKLDNISDGCKNISSKLTSNTCYCKFFNGTEIAEPTDVPCFCQYSIDEKTKDKYTNYPVINYHQTREYCNFTTILYRPEHKPNDTLKNESAVIECRFANEPFSFEKEYFNFTVEDTPKFGKLEALPGVGFSSSNALTIDPITIILLLLFNMFFLNKVFTKDSLNGGSKKKELPKLHKA